MVLRCTVMEEKLTNSDPFITSTDKHSIYTYCICSNHSAIILLYQWLPTSIQCGEAMARRRKEDGRVGSASRGMVRRLGRFFSRVRPRVSQIAREGLIGATPRGQPWTSA